MRLAIQLSHCVVKVLLEDVRVLFQGVLHAIAVNGVDVVRRPDLDVIMRAAARHATLTGHLAKAVHHPTRDHALTRLHHPAATDEG